MRRFHRLQPILLVAVAALAGCETLPEPTAAPKIPLQPEAHGLPPSPPAGVYDVSNVDQVPVAKYRAHPQYPFELRKAGIAGKAVILALIDTTGDVINVTVVSSTDFHFGDAAMQAVTKWKFSPALVSGRPVRCQIAIPIEFSLNEG